MGVTVLLGLLYRLEAAVVRLPIGVVAGVEYVGSPGCGLLRYAMCQNAIRESDSSLQCLFGNCERNANMLVGNLPKQLSATVISENSPAELTR